MAVARRPKRRRRRSPHARKLCAKAGHQEDLPPTMSRARARAARVAERPLARAEVTPLRVSRSPNKAGHGATLPLTSASSNSAWLPTRDATFCWSIASAPTAVARGFLCAHLVGGLIAQVQ